MTGFDEQFARSAMAAHPHERRGGGSLPTRMIRLESPAHEALDPATSDLVVGLVLEGQAGAAWSWDGARPNTTRRRRPGTLGVTPVGSVGRFEVDGPSSLLIVALPYRGLAERLEPDASLRRDLGVLHDAYTDRLNARRLCSRLWTVAGCSGPVSDLEIDWLSERLAVELAGPTPDGRIDRSVALSALERARVRAAAEQQNADVAYLASAIAMPVRTFRRRFHASFGTAPHRWLISQRIERAKRDMCDRSRSLSGIALDLGFASQAHFSDTFKRETGMSPGRFRRVMST
jgi:AraC-like DNA-binding protein